MSPWLVRNVLYPAHEWLIGRPTHGVLHGLQASQWWPAKQHEQDQERKLRALLLQAWDHCPAHRSRLADVGFSRIDLAFFRRNHLPLLPLMDKATIRAHVDQLVDRSVPGGVFRYATGGSTGEPLTFYIDRRRQAHDQAARMRTHAWFGVQPGEREVYLWGSPVELSRQDRIKLLRDRLTNQLLLNAFAMSPATMSRYLERIRRFRPACLFGYPSSLAMLAGFARETTGGRVVLPGLKAVFVTGEKLYDHQRELLEQTFGVPVADCLGSRDAGFLAHECPSGSMHITSESLIVEVVDSLGRPVPAGELGEIVVTHLENHALPFLRYRTGDLGRSCAESCACGRGLPRLLVAEGRSTDHLFRDDGAAVHALAVIYVLRELAGIRAFRVHQPSLAEVVVRVVRGADYPLENDAAIVRGIRSRLGPSVRVDVVAVESLPPERSGKFRYVTSDVVWRESAHGQPTPGDRAAIGAR
jgi:phenylacetate-CoA ligase